MNILMKTFLHLRAKGLTNWVPDKLYLKAVYKGIMGKRLKLQETKTFNEKLQWLKLYDKKPEYMDMVDKYEAKKFCAGILGEEYIIPTLGLWNSFDEIDFDKLPNQFVLKCTHNSGGIVICKDKSKLDIEQARKTINDTLANNYFYWGREWPYKNVKPRIIAETYMQDETGGLADYKFFCFNGKADCVMVCLDRHLNDTKFYFFDREWNLLRINRRGLEAAPDFTIPKLSIMDEMFEVADMLSKDIPFVRVDLYGVKDKIYFSEMTFYPDSGFDCNLLPQADARWSKLMENIGG